jgi:hypothetical protein
MGPGVSPAKFHENVCDFGIVYGLALQGLGIARIESNLLPRNIARSMAWASKSKYFIAAACMLLAVSLLCFARTGWDGLNYDKNQPVRKNTGDILTILERAQQNLKDVKRKGSESEATIEKEKEPFKYREMIPRLHEIIISALPNEKNNPKQAKLYQAFANGNVEGILEIPRKAREQIFITNMEVFFSNDLATAQFGGADLFRTTRGSPGARGDEMYEDSDMMRMDMMRMDMMGMEMMGDPRYQLTPGGMFGMGGPTAEEKMPGFVITVAGYSPYEKIGKLMDPYGVEDEQDKWGLVTRLLHLEDFFVDGNSPFEVYKKIDPNHFKLEIGEVILEKQMPVGIGITDVRYRPTPPGSTQGESAEWVLIDPMTKETISKIPEWEANGRPKLYPRRDPRSGTQIHTVNDHWFVLNVKFLWIDAPEAVKVVAPTFQGMMGRLGMGGQVLPQTSGSTGEKDLKLGIE